MQLFIRLSNLLKRNRSKLLFAIRIVIFGSLCVTSQVSRAEESSTKVSDVDTSEGTESKIRKGVTDQKTVLPDFELITESDEIVGDAMLNRVESKGSWDAACEKWKKEIKTLNQKNEILGLKCGVPEEVKEGNGLRSFRSTGTYKLRVRTKESIQDSDQSTSE